MRHDQGGAEEDQQGADSGGCRANTTRHTSPHRYRKIKTNTESPCRIIYNIAVCCLWSELWKKVPLKHSLSLERPQIVEMFMKQLMDGAEEAEGQVEQLSNDSNVSLQLT